MDKPFCPELADEKVVIFGVYAAQTYALVIQDGKILYKQETSVSAEQLNQLIQRTYQVTAEKAEEIINSPQKPSDYQESVANYFNQQITQEIQRVLQFYYTTQTADDMTDIKHILLTGKRCARKASPKPSPRKPMRMYNASIPRVILRTTSKQTNNNSNLMRRH